ncbi:MAG TPA: type II toxin-antitoxin system PemK/MazF family toxin [Desulfobacterales bacterium]|nr:type II toxin-antitoxin system PemK/MazF family toxin [Desulfobacterales bacterium]
MAKFVKGDIVVVPFPFTDLTQSKRRPAFVISELSGDDRILCQITSQSVRDEYSVSIDDSDFETGGLHHKSNVRPNRIFTCDMTIILYRIGHLKSEKIKQITNKLIEILKS